MELTRTFSAQEFTEALTSWQWMDLEGLDPWFATAFGDVFLIGDDGVYWLDVAAGELSRPFGSPEEAQRVLATEEGMDEYLLAGLVFAAAEEGVEATGEDILWFKEPPVFDGEYEVANLAPARFVAAVADAGRLHERIKDLPEGAEIPDHL
ncbi:MAG: hypothetical protein QM655_04405 [Nocardioidaceae bacterium]